MSPLVGIDLGTTNSALAVLDRTGRPEIIPNGEGDHITPSAVFFEPGSSHTSVVGQAAKDNAVVYPSRVFQAFKRDMATNSPYSLDGIHVTPVELSSLLLRKLVQDASKQTGAITGAVITVPANFTNEARLATMKAGELAGLEVSHIINEPTAALFYYSYHQPVGGTVVVYDFGGGTLDVTIARVTGRDVQILASKGDPRLGGLDFDRKLDDIVRRTFEASSAERFDPEVHQLGKTSEEYKKQLSSRTETSVQVVGGRVGRKILTVTRQEFEAATSTLISKADLLVDSTLDEVALRPSDISNVFLVGGSTRMPMVTTHLTRLFGRAPICHVNPDEVVALGAALYAGLNAQSGQLNAAQAAVVRSMKLQEVANHFFGTIAVERNPTGESRLRNSVIIEKNTALPCAKTESYYTVSPGQTAVDCRVTQSATRETDPDFVRVIWDGSLGPLPPGRPAQMEIRVTYSYDTNQIMHCVFEDVASGVKKEIEIGLKTDSDGSNGDGVEKFLVE
jgi:molecular chaperone DnaK